MLKTMKRKVIAFCGFEQSGKDYSCRILMETRGFKKVAFADALREVAFKTLGMTMEDGMKNYENLKSNPIYGNLTFRNILENLGSAIRRYDRNFWAKTVLVKLIECTDNICISDLRYANEYKVVSQFCRERGIEFKLVFCDYHSEKYNDKNPHESARFAKYLKDLGYKDQEYVSEVDVNAYIASLNGGK